MILPASYGNGFAPRDGQPLYPELWRDCVGAWAPCLGPTGLSLRDWSGRARHGVFSGMIADTAWITSAGRHCLQFGNLTTQNVSVDSTSWSTVSGTLCCWVQKTTATAANNDYIFWSKVTSGTNRIYIEIETYDGLNGVGTNPQITAAFGASVVGNVVSNPSATSLNSWTHVGLSWSNGTPMRLWINGRNTASTANNYAAQSETTTEILGNYSGGTVSFGGNVDDTRRYNRALSGNEIRTLASRRGIAYELAPRRRSRELVAAFNRRRRLLLGAS